MNDNFLSGFNQPAFKTAVAPAPKKAGGLKGVLSGLLQAPSYFARTDIINPLREDTAMVTGNKLAYNNALKSESATIGKDPGQAAKRLGGNTAQVASLFVPGGGGLTSRTVQGVRAGAIAGGGSAAANDQNILKGAGEGAVVGGVIPGVFKILGLGGKGAANVTGVTAAKDALRNRGGSAASKAVPATPKGNGFINNLLTTGEQMEGRNLHVSGGEKVGPKELFPQDTSRMLSTLKNEGIPVTGNANTTARALQDKLDEHAQTINDVLDKNNKPLSATDKRAMLKEYADKIDKNPSIDAPARKAATNLAKNLDKHGSTDVKSLVNFTRGLDKDALNYNANPDSATTAKQLAARTLRQVVKGRINKLAPDLKEANNSYHDLAEMKPFIAKGMKEQNQPTGGIAGRVASSGPIQKVEATLGKGAQKLAKAGGAGNPAEAPLIAAEQNRGNVALKNLLRPAATTGLAADVGNQEPPQDAGGMNQLLNSSAGGSGDNLDSVSGLPGFYNGNNQSQDSEQPDTPFTSEAIQEAILADIQSTGGKNIAALTSLYKTFGTPDKTSVKAQDAKASGDQALDIIDNLEQAYNKAGGAKGRVGGTVGSILGKVGENDASNVYNTSKTTFLSNVARSLGEKGVLTDADIDRIAQGFPSLTSTPGEAAARWAMIKTIISGGIQRAQDAYANSSSPNSEGPSLAQ